MQIPPESPCINKQFACRVSQNVSQSDNGHFYTMFLSIHLCLRKNISDNLLGVPVNGFLTFRCKEEIMESLGSVDRLRFMQKFELTCKVPDNKVESSNCKIRNMSFPLVKHDSSTCKVTNLSEPQ